MDLTANGGINPHTGVAWVAGDTYRLVFCTEDVYQATSTNISTYNAYVQADAEAACLGDVTWYCIGSTATVDAVDNTVTTGTDTDGAFFLMDGSTTAASNIAEFWGSSWAGSEAIDLNENGATPSTGSITTGYAAWNATWTGTAGNGTASNPLGGGTTKGGIASGAATAAQWIARFSDTDSKYAHLYAMSEVLTVTAEPAECDCSLGILDTDANGGINPYTGAAWAVGDRYRLVFCTEDVYQATSTNISTYNTAVQADAAAAGYGTADWFCIGSTATVDATDNTNTSGTDFDGAFFLMDGSTIVASNKCEFWAGAWAGSEAIDLNENGATPSTGSITTGYAAWNATWTGTAGDGTASNPLGGGTTKAGIASGAATSAQWIARFSDTDSKYAHLYAMSEALKITALPVELIYFTAQMKDSHVLIKWKTGAEINNDYFLLQKSIDGTTFETIANIQGAGNSLEPIEYSYTDSEIQNEVIYYRIIQVDFDGTSETFKTVMVNTNEKTNEFNLTIYPQPIENIAKINFKVPEEGLYNFKIYDIVGEAVYSSKLVGIKGVNWFEINMSTFNSGTYIFSLSDNNGRVITQKAFNR